jgi:hypothetical protein
MAGVPHVLVRYVVLGGIYRQSTAGAVPNAVNGLAVPVPPEMLFTCPQPVLAGAFQVVTSVSTVEAALTAAVVLIKLEVYRYVASFICIIVVAAAPGVNEYHPVVDASVVCVPPVPPRLNPV